MINNIFPLLYITIQKKIHVWHVTLVNDKTKKMQTMYTNYYVIGIADINITCINERNRKKKRNKTCVNLTLWKT